MAQPNHEQRIHYIHGLSYTTFKFSNLRTSSPRLAADGTVTVSVDVTNTGRRAGDQVVQLYVKHLHSAVARPREELEGFLRVALDAGGLPAAALVLLDFTLSVMVPEVRQALPGRYSG